MGIDDEGSTYRLKNLKGETYLDLSAGDYYSILGYEENGGDNQKWELTNTGEGWTIKSPESGKFLGIEGDPYDGIKVVAVDHDGTRWDLHAVDEDEDLYKIFLRDTPFVIDLSDHGNSSNGTPIELWGSWEADNQVWKFKKEGWF